MLVLYEKVLILVRNAFFFIIVNIKVNNNNNLKIRMVSSLI